LKVFCHGWDDDGDILRCDGGFVDRLDGLICPIACEVDPQSEVPEEAESASQLSRSKAGVARQWWSSVA
jgi:hypothetical protein